MTKNRWWNCIQTGINKWQIEKRGKRNRAVSPLKRQRSALDYSAIEEEEEKILSQIQSVVLKLVLPSIKTLSSNFCQCIGRHTRSVLISVLPVQFQNGR